MGYDLYMFEWDLPEVEFWIRMDYTPGFATDLTSWIAMITDDGKIVLRFIIANYANHFKGERVVVQGALTKAEIIRVRLLIEQARFESMKSKYTVPLTDMADQNMAIRFGDSVKEVQAYAAPYLAYKGSLEMKSFLRLWSYLEKRLPKYHRGKSRRKRNTFAKFSELARNELLSIFNIATNINNYY